MPCWISERDILPAANYQAAIVAALGQARAMVVLISEASNASGEILKELSLASAADIPVFPVRLAPVTPNPALSYELATRQWIDGSDARAVTAKLIAAIQGSAGSPSEVRANQAAIPPTANTAAVPATVTLLCASFPAPSGERRRKTEGAAQDPRQADDELLLRWIGDHGGQQANSSAGSILATFDSARRAVACAIDLQRAAHARALRHPGTALKLRIGLHTGEATRTGQELAGPSVDVAAAIMARAGDEQILVSDVLKSIMGVAPDVHLEDRRRVRLKGLAETWRLWEVLWRPEAEAQAAEAGGTGAISWTGRTPYVGRTEELGVLRQGMERAMAGVGSVILVAGEAGLGKTRLVEEVARDAKARRMFVVRGQCHDMEGAPPYAPFVEAIEYGLTVTAREAFRAAMGDAGPEIARFVPKVRVAFPDLPPPVALPSDQARHYMFECICDFFERAAKTQPMFIVLEDLHWADKSTTQLLESLARRVDRAALLVIGTYRDVDLSPGDPFMAGIAQLSRLPMVVRMTLKRLSAAEVADILHALSSRPPPARLSQVIYAETEGVPLFVEEVYRYLAEEGRLSDAAGNWLPQVEIGEIEVPETVRLVLGRRIDRISETAQRIMATAACLGRTFTFELLAALVDDKDDDLIDALEEAERARLVVTEQGRRPRFVFAHEQIRQTLLSRLSFMRRQRLHRRVADTLERLHAGQIRDQVSELAYHLAQAGEGERAASYLHQAGMSAAARLATPEALDYFARAADLAGPGPTRRAALRARGELLLGLFRGREAAADLELSMNEAAADGATAEEMEALLRLGRAYYVIGLDHGPAIVQSLAALHRARDLAVQLGDRHGEARALIPTHRHIDFDPSYVPQARANAERALAIARELGDAELEVDALRAANRMRPISARGETIERIAEALERRGDLIALNEHLFDSMWSYWRAARFAECVACCDRATALAARLGIPPVQYGTIKSFALVDMGRFDDAWRALEQEVADDEHPFGRLVQQLGRAWWHSAAGDAEQVLRDAPGLFAGAHALKRSWMIPWIENLLAAAIVTTSPQGTQEAALADAVAAAGGKLAGETLAASLLRAGNPAAAQAECERILPALDAEGQTRLRWLIETLRIRALLDQQRYTAALEAAEVVLAAVAGLDWQSLVWRLQATRSAALAALGDTRAEAARQAGTNTLRLVAETLDDASARACFLSQPEAAKLRA